MPAILTGLILAIARATGEVAPLMITGVVKLAPQLPWTATSRICISKGVHAPGISHIRRRLSVAERRGGKAHGLHDGLLLILIVVVLNLTAIIIRNRLRKKYTTSAV